jgi:membrane protease YdiL (CAAX protease family)
MKTPARKFIVRAYLAVEFTMLFFGVPLLIYADPEFIHPSMLIIPLLIIIFLVLRFTTDFRFRDLVYFRVGKKHLLRNGVIILACSSLMLLYVLVFEPERLFDLVRGNFPVWLILCTFYPVFSAYGQEIIYRTFLFKRYERLFTGRPVMILASGISFSFLHIVYYSPVSIILTFIGGVYFASEYARTKSVLYTAILHGILGVMVFTAGLGEYFWLDMYDWIRS